MTRIPPPHVRSNPNALASWRKYGHILPPLAFEQVYENTVLLPILSRSVQRDVDRLRSVIEDHLLWLTEKEICRIAGLRFCLNYARTRMLLKMREGLEWSSFLRESRDEPLYTGEIEPSLVAAVPAEVSVEYLVAELERHGYEFEVRGTLGERTLSLMSWRVDGVMPRQEYDAWMERFRGVICEYIRHRDGILPIAAEPARFVLEENRHPPRKRPR